MKHPRAVLFFIVPLSLSANLTLHGWKLNAFIKWYVVVIVTAQIILITSCSCDCRNGPPNGLCP